MNFSFSKYSGAGNDFILIDNRDAIFPVNDPSLIAKMCHRNDGIGADGVILLENTPLADASMRIFNSDGFEAEMCGNGARCFMHYMHSLGYDQDSYRVLVFGRVLLFNKNGEDYAIDMGDATDLRLSMKLDIAGLNPVHHINTGVPHIVYFVDSLQTCDVVSLGRQLRYHPAFRPQGANVNFVEKRQNDLWVRTYERGVEGETKACGTGATASALIASIIYDLPSPVSVHVSSNVILSIDFVRDGLNFSKIYMTGPAQHIFTGSIQLD